MGEAPRFVRLLGTAVGPMDRGFGLGMEMQLEADDGRRDHVVLGELQLVFVDRIDRQRI